jgi:glutamine amidotransferase
MRSGAFLAAARLASPGATLVETGNAPFVEGSWAFSLNGIVRSFTDGVGDELRARIQPARRDALVGDADTEVLFALVLQHLDDGMPPADALATVVHDVLALTTGRLNLLLTDGATVYGTRVGNSLFHRGSVIVSEPTDDGAGWHEVPDRSVTVLTFDDAVDTPL